MRLWTIEILAMVCVLAASSTAAADVDWLSTLERLISPRAE